MDAVPLATVIQQPARLLVWGRCLLRGRAADAASRAAGVRWRFQIISYSWPGARSSMKVAFAERLSLDQRRGSDLNLPPLEPRGYDEWKPSGRLSR